MKMKWYANHARYEFILQRSMGMNNKWKWNGMVCLMRYYGNFLSGRVELPGGTEVTLLTPQNLAYVFKNETVLEFYDLVDLFAINILIFKINSEMVLNKDIMLAPRNRPRNPPTLEINSWDWKASTSSIIWT